MGRMQPKRQVLLLVKTAKENQNAPAWGMAKDAPPHVSARVAVHGSSSRVPRSSVSGKRKRVEAIYRRENSSTFLRSAGMSTNAGPWTN